MNERFTLTVALAAALLCFGSCRAALEGDAVPPDPALIPGGAETKKAETPPAVLSSVITSYSIHYTKLYD